MTASLVPPGVEGVEGLVTVLAGRRVVAPNANFKPLP